MVEPYAPPTLRKTIRKDTTMTRIRKLRWTGLALAVALAVAAPAFASQNRTITIHHQMRGCHAWALGATGQYKPSLSVSLTRGATLQVVNNDVMPHTLVQTSGPNVKIVTPAMRRVGATASARFAKTGVYRFTTRAGEDYKWASKMKTTGEDYVLRLTVTVR
jgi:plastocyanin